MFTPNCYNSSKHDSTHPLNLSLRALVFVYHTFNTQGVRWSLSIGCSVSNSCIHSTMYEADSSSEVALTHFHLMNRYRAKQLLAKRLHSCPMCICTRRMTGRKLHGIGSERPGSLIMTIDRSNLSCGESSTREHMVLR